MAYPEETLDFARSSTIVLQCVYLLLDILFAFCFKVGTRKFKCGEIETNKLCHWVSLTAEFKGTWPCMTEMSDYYYFGTNAHARKTASSRRQAGINLKWSQQPMEDAIVCPGLSVLSSFCPSVFISQKG